MNNYHQKTFKAAIINTRIKGQNFEQLALHYLEQQGLKLECQNYHKKTGEIDLIMRHKAVLVFIEVKYRKNNQFGGAIHAVNRNKQKKIAQTAQIYLQTEQKNSQHQACRFDVVAIDGEQYNIQWLQNAFELF